MVYIHEVAVQLDVQVAARLHGAVCYGRGRRVGYACEDGVRGQRDEGDGAAGEGAGVVFDAEEAGEVWLDPGRDGGRRCLRQDGLVRGGGGDDGLGGGFDGVGFAVCGGWGGGGDGCWRHLARRCMCLGVGQLCIQQW